MRGRVLGVDETVEEGGSFTAIQKLYCFLGVRVIILLFNCSSAKRLVKAPHTQRGLGNLGGIFVNYNAV